MILRSLFPSLPYDGDVASETPTSDQQTWAVLAHASAFIQFVSIPSFFGPLVVWLLKREDPVVEPHAREALNFQISLFVYFALLVVAAIVLLLTIVGILLWPVLLIIGLGLFVAEIVFALLGSMAASRGELYRYPMNLRLIKG